MAEGLATRTTEAILEGLVGGCEMTEGESPHYIHLRDVTLMTPGLQSAETGGLWRERLEAVDGFMLGTLGSEERAVVAPPGKGGYEKDREEPSFRAPALAENKGLLRNEVFQLGTRE